MALAQIYPVWDEDTSDERIVIRASFADPYLAILRDDLHLLLLQMDSSGDIDEVSLSEEMTSSKWISCCLYNDKTGKLFPGEGNKLLLFLLGSDSKLYVSKTEKETKEENRTKRKSKPHSSKLTTTTLDISTPGPKLIVGR